MNFIGKLLGKFFRYVMLFAMILLGLNSVEAFSQGQGSFPELLVTLGMLYLVYKFLVPLVERFLAFFAGVNLGPQQRQAPRRWAGVVSGGRLDHGLQRSGLQLRSGSQAGGK